MCGIAGQFNRSGQAFSPAQKEFIFNALKRRGPEAKGEKSFALPAGQLELFHRRLSIIELSEEGQQPMQSASGRCWISFNGEIYNYQAIRTALSQEYVKLNTLSDTEVIMAAYEQWGLQTMLDKIDGMFAFALFDQKENKLFLVRDRLGKKPLYYSWTGQALFFSSDIRIVKAQLPQAQLDLASLDYYLTELSSPQPHTIWQEIKQVPPAQLLELELQSGAPQLSTYWRLKKKEPLDLNLNEALEQTENMLRKAIRKRLVSDVPIACFLSGGVDSGLITALMAEESSQRVPSFTIGFAEAIDMNEFAEAKALAQRYDCDHHEIVVEDQLFDQLEDLMDYFGEPFADASILPSSLVCQAVSKEYKVALSGDGGDELFGGYPDYGLAFRSSQFAKKYPQNQYLISQLDKLLNRLKGKKENMGAYYAYLQLPPEKRLFRQMGFWSKEALYAQKQAPKAQEHLQTIWSNFAGSGTAVDQLMRSSLHSRLLNDYLPKVDRASMYHSLEVRSPFLDIDLLNFAFNLPDELKFYQNQNKFLLKQLAKTKIDPQILNRPKKGFSIPIGDWLRGSAKNWGEELLQQLKKRPYFQAHYLDTLWENHQKASNNADALRIWTLLCFELWAEKHLD
ncbi:asparagine synthase (glutamine-hydrolyzing) [Saprospira grandis]|uniref:asparagine synthase (glutamine-hydrolyzing) n=1 Tax=Saprospira grandis (strain Lewin) TaxID=984262 RepID=H6L7A3_SAPGL|nr:asparagine synthase (glutamine-hydrolyzing) [Saprospira grandis]AFC26775.1 asparagine synthase [Saprospira grandis str. Lewin]